MTSEPEVSFQWIIFIANCASNLLRQKLREEFPLVTLPGMKRSCGHCWGKKSWNLSKPCTEIVPVTLALSSEKLGSLLKAWHERLCTPSCATLRPRRLGKTNSYGVRLIILVRNRKFREIPNSLGSPKPRNSVLIVADIAAETSPLPRSKKS